MKTIFHIIAFLLKNIICEDDLTTNASPSTVKVGISRLLFFVVVLMPELVFGQAAASFNYTTQSGTIGTTYSWIDCTAGDIIVSGDDAQASISWPFDFAFYDNAYTTSDNLSVSTNGFIRLDDVVNSSYQTAVSYELLSSSTELGQIIALAVYDGQVRDNSGWLRKLTTGVAPNRIFTIEYHNLEIDYNDNLFADVQVSFYETSNKVVLKLGSDNITKDGVDMGLHSGVDAFFNKWQEVKSGTNDTWVEYTPTSAPPVTGPQASWNYATKTGATGSTYSWVDCSSGNSIVSGDDAEGSILWPFDFSYYDNDYTTSDYISTSTNGIIRLDGTASTDYAAASNYALTSTATTLGQIIALATYDGNIGSTGWVKSVVTGTTPNQVLTIEYNNLEVDYNDNRFVDVQVSFYESTNRIVLKLGDDNIAKSGVDMGLHSGVSTFYSDWQEIKSGSNNSWIEYTPKNIEVSATIGASTAYYATLKEAFDKVNDGTYQGNVTVKVNHSTTETASAVLKGSGIASASYVSVNLYPTKAGLSINGDVPAPIIDLDGADNVIIDGRVNASGATKELSIINTSTASYGGNSAIRFVNGASNNTVKYCTIKSSETKSTYGILFFSTSTSSLGNNNNVIDNNNITNA
ncbi:MAG: hypothetical protein PF444_00970, partial [Bacteroidales bacterium]|nr:hypothetical protein [Bacteroidales bacterium]